MRISYRKVFELTCSVRKLGSEKASTTLTEKPDGSSRVLSWFSFRTSRAHGKFGLFSLSLPKKGLLPRGQWEKVSARVQCHIQGRLKRQVGLSRNGLRPVSSKLLSHDRRNLLSLTNAVHELVKSRSINWDRIATPGEKGGRQLPYTDIDSFFVPGPTSRNSSSFEERRSCFSDKIMIRLLRR
ncbi:hypothetical protein STAS_09676 [Striga asiatica]|uniref:Uncharacterized protein n=1 Tax=Striga asiatica TaxID=4170 RepID=A0A5A7PLS1_STRAF|nr:hypothetical protein STAS_09676 [Striga asiatica]